MDEIKIFIDKKSPCHTRCGINLTVFMKKIDLIKNLTLTYLLLSKSVYSCVLWKHSKDLIFKYPILSNAIGIGYINLIISRSKLYLLKGFRACGKKSVGAQVALLLCATG